MKTAAQQRSYQERRRGRCLAEGLCVRCAKADAVASKTMREPCLKTFADRQTRRRRALSGAGRCTVCGMDTIGRTLCARCMEASAGRSAKWRAKNTAAGLCACGHALMPGFLQCGTCKDSRTKRAALRTKELRTRGLCTCGHEKEIKGQCRTCWFANVAIRATHRRANGPVLELLFEAQGRRCALTGVSLVPGLNASIDHKVPRAKGGSDDIGNLQWVDLKVNLMKRDMDIPEFLTACESVLAFAGKVVKS